MTEENLFYLMFLLQVLLLSVVQPLRILRLYRRQMRLYPEAQYPWLYPWSTRQLTRLMLIYRLIHWVVAAGGLLLFAWFYRYMQNPDWSDGVIEVRLALYFMLQMLPLLLHTAFAYRINSRLRASARPLTVTTASLQRRSLRQFAPGWLINLTLALYPVYMLYLWYLSSNPPPGFAGFWVNAITVTLLYSWCFGFSLLSLSKRKMHPLQSHDSRQYEMAMTVKLCVFSCLLGVIFLATNMTLVLFDQQSLEPFAMSLYFVICAVSYLFGMNPPEHQLDLGAYEPA